MSENTPLTIAPNAETFSAYGNLPPEISEVAEAAISLRNFYSLTLEDLKAEFKKVGKEQFRSQQIFKWVYEHRVTDPALMSNLSKDFRAELPKSFSFEMPQVLKHLKSVDGTQKLLFDVGHGNTVEAVLIPTDDRLTLCIFAEIGIALYPLF